jgi:tRNA threonylcarbamoyladenosine biosynthesis protein TsaB
LILGFDTATSATAVGVWAPGGPSVEVRDDPIPGQRPAHASRLLVLIEEALAVTGEGWREVERIAVGVGPGGFTGLRLGIATARALAQARGLPLVGVSSLEALAAGAAPGSRGSEAGDLRSSEAGDLRGSAADEAAGPVVAVIDARRGEVFAAAPGRFGAVALAPEDLAARLEPGSLAVGDGAVRFRDELERAGAVVPVDGSELHRVSALQVCRLGADMEPADRDALLPDYRREPDAKPRQP